MDAPRQPYYYGSYNGYNQYLNTGLYPKFEDAPPSYADSVQAQPINPDCWNMKDSRQKVDSSLIPFYKRLLEIFPGHENRPSAPMAGRVCATETTEGSGTFMRLFTNGLDLLVQVMRLRNDQSQRPATTNRVSGIGNTVINETHIHHHAAPAASSSKKSKKAEGVESDEEDERQAQRRKQKEEEKANTAGAAALAIGIAGGAAYGLGHVGKHMMPDNTQVREIDEFMKGAELDHLIPYARPLSLVEKMDLYAIPVMLASGSALAVTKLAPAIFNKPGIPFVTLMAAVIFKGVYQGAKADRQPFELTYFAGPRIRQALVQKLEYYQNKRNSAFVNMAGLVELIGCSTAAAASYFIPTYRKYHTVSWQGVKVVAVFLAVKWIAETAYNKFVREPAIQKLDNEMHRAVQAELLYTESLL